MACKYACVCSGKCWADNCYEPESYCGEAEDIYDEIHGRSSRQSEYDTEYEKYMQEEYERAMMEQYEEQATQLTHDRGEI